MVVWGHHGETQEPAEIGGSETRNSCESRSMKEKTPASNEGSCVLLDKITHIVYQSLLMHEVYDKQNTE